MKFLVALCLIIIFSFICCLYFPWWSIAIVSFIMAALIPQKAFKSFITSFLALFILWGSLSFWISYKNDHILAHKVSLLILKADSPFTLILLTACIGALVAGFAAIAGSYLRKMVG